MPIPPDPPAALLTEIRQQCELPVAPELQILCLQVRARFGDAVAAVLFHGSCLRSGDPGQGLVDLYVLVDSYASAYPSRVLRIANAWLPPNVFMLTTRAADGRALQAKYAVLSLADFDAGCGRWFQCYVWGRFAQPSRLVYSRDDQARNCVYLALAQAVARLLRETLPLMPERFDSEAIWQRGLTLSYGTELRAEAPERPAQLVHRDLAYFNRLSAAAVPAVGELHALAADHYRQQLPLAQCRRARRRWQLRRQQGRLLHVLRLIKSVLTFDNGVDYIAWKLERHTGCAIEITPRLRRHPLIFGWPILWRLLRQRRLR